MNIPNKLTVGRLALTIVFFVFLGIGLRANEAAAQVILNISLAIFIIAAGTDFVDGWYARKYQMVTDFGRVADPFADKILICGALILLLAKGQNASRVCDWMVVIIIAREFMVSGMRSLIESKNIPFGAISWGKYKTLSQTFAISFSLLYVANGIAALKPLVDGILYVTTAITAASGVVYALRAKRILSIDA